MIEAFTDNFLKPGNLAGGFAHYRAAHAGRVKMMKGEAPKLPPISGADLRALGRARSAVSLCLDRPARRNFFQSRSRDVFRRRALPASGRSGSCGQRDRRLLHAHRMELKVGPPDATKNRRPRAASLKFRPGSAASPTRESDRMTVTTGVRRAQRDPVLNLTGQGYPARRTLIDMIYSETASHFRIMLQSLPSLPFFAFFRPCPSCRPSLHPCRCAGW